LLQNVKYSQNVSQKLGRAKLVERSKKNIKNTKDKENKPYMRPNKKHN